MPTPSYRIDCPKCGKTLQPVALSAQSAPWLCAGCGLGFWSSELSASSRALYRPTYNDFGLGVERVSIHAAIALEVADAEVRGTSLRHDQFTLAPESVLAYVASSPHVEASFKALVNTHITNSKGAA